MFQSRKCCPVLLIPLQFPKAENVAVLPKLLNPVLLPVVSCAVFWLNLSLTLIFLTPVEIEIIAKPPAPSHLKVTQKKNVQLPLVEAKKRTDAKKYQAKKREAARKKVSDPDILRLTWFTDLLGTILVERHGIGEVITGEGIEQETWTQFLLRFHEDFRVCSKCSRVYCTRVQHKCPPTEK